MSTGAGGAGTTENAGSGNSAGEGQAGEPSCLESTGNCSCAWLAPSCDDGKGLYSGQTCPPTFDEARLVANWPLGGPPMSGTARRSGEYEECDDGTRSFMFHECGDFEEFGFDAQGNLSVWGEAFQICLGRVCGSSTTSSALCRICEMWSDASAAGTGCVTQKMNNGPTPACTVDAAGHWVMPPLCDD